MVDTPLELDDWDLQLEEELKASAQRAAKKGTSPLLTTGHTLAGSGSISTAKGKQCSPVEAIAAMFGPTPRSPTHEEVASGHSKAPAATAAPSALSGRPIMPPIRGSTSAGAIASNASATSSGIPSLDNLTLQQRIAILVAHGVCNAPARPGVVARPRRKRNPAPSERSVGTVGSIMREVVMQRPMDRNATDELRKALEQQQRPANPVEAQCDARSRELQEKKAKKKKAKERRLNSPKSDAATYAHEEPIEKVEQGSARFSSDSFGSYATSNTMSTSPSWVAGPVRGAYGPHAYDPIVWDEHNSFLSLEGRPPPQFVHLNGSATAAAATAEGSQDIPRAYSLMNSWR